MSTAEAAPGPTLPIRPPLATRVTLALCSWLIPAVAASQVVRGVVVEETSGRAIPGAVVVLLDSAGKRLGGVLTDDDGRYALRAMAPGRYAVRAERIGFRADAPGDVRLGPGETVELRLVTRPIPVVLGEVRVTGRTPCVARASDGREVSAVWEEARKALYAADLTQREELFTVRVSRFQRTLDPRTGRVTSYETTERRGASRSPFVSAPPARLSAEGFVQQQGKDLVYWGPDAPVLLSEEFLGDHCFRLRAGEGARAGLIGLQFEPTRRRDKPDIAGTLWIDRGSAELRDIEYAYQNLPNLPGNVPSERFGGRIEFHRMPNGAWIVERWVIRMPLLADAGPLSRRNEAAIPGSPGYPEERIQLAAVREEGGEVMETVARGARRALAADRAAVRGTVFDSTRMTPLANARVFLDGTQFSATSLGDGTFTIDGVPAGRYALSVVHPRFDSLHVRAPTVPVELRRGGPASATLAGPSAATILARDCTAEEMARGPAALRGYVGNAVSGGPAIDASVLVTWNQLGAAGRVSSVSERRLETRADSAGRYDLCGLPEDVKLTVRAATAEWRGAPAQVVLAGREVSVLHLSVGRPGVVAAAPPETMDTVAVRAPRLRNRAMEAVERRRRRGVGSFLVRQQIEHSHATRVTDLLRMLPGVTVRSDERGVQVVELRGSTRITANPTGAAPAPAAPSDSGSAPSPGRSAARATAQASIQRCLAGYRVDGLPVDAMGGIDSDVQPEDVDAIEVYSSAQVPLEFAGHDSACGLVMIWTRRFAGLHDLPKPDHDGAR